MTKTYRLCKGADGFEVELKFESPDEDAQLVYKLLGPHGIPIEGEWYTGTFRDVFFGQVDGSSDEDRHHARPTTSPSAKDEPERFQTLPLEVRRGREPVFRHLRRARPAPDDARGPLGQRGGRRSSSTTTRRPRRRPTSASRSRRSRSRSARTAPVTHTYRVFAGPKTAEALTPYDAEDLATYRKNQWFGIPFAAYIADVVITPLLDLIYELTAAVARRLRRQGRATTASRSSC